MNIRALYVKESELQNAVAINATKGKAYNTLQSAITAVSTDGKENTIKLLKNTNESTTTTSGQNIALDLNGKTISVTAYRSPTGISNNGTLTIKDSSENNNGNIIVEGTIYSYGIYNAGDLKIIQGNIKSTASIDNTYGIRQETNGSIELLGGTITASGDDNAYGIWGYKDESIKILGGVINATSKDRVSYGIYTYDSNLVIENGNINATSKDKASYGIYSNCSDVVIESGNINAISKSNNQNSQAWGIYNYCGNNVTISEAKITVEAVFSYGIKNIRGSLKISRGNINATNGIDNDYGTVTITGGNITSTNYYLYAIVIRNRESGIVTITGGTMQVTNDVSSAIGIENGNTGVVTVSGGAIKVKRTGNTGYSEYGIFNTTGTIIVEGGKIAGSESTTSDKGISNDSGKVKISGGSITGIYNGSGEVEISNGTITSNIYNNSGTVNVSGGEIKVKEDSYEDRAITNYGNIIVTGGTIRGKDTVDHIAAIWNGNNGNLTIGEKDGIINSEQPKIYGVENSDYNDGVCNFYDGQVLGLKGTIDGVLTQIEENSQVHEDTEEVNGEIYRKLTLIKEKEYEESIALINGEGDFRKVSSLI